MKFCDNHVKLKHHLIFIKAKFLLCGRVNENSLGDIFNSLLCILSVNTTTLLTKRGVVAEWFKSVAFHADVSQRRFESGRGQTVTVTASILWQGSLNLSSTSPMTNSDDETDVKTRHFILFNTRWGKNIPPQSINIYLSNRSADVNQNSGDY